MSPAEIELTEFFESIAGSANHIKIYKIVEGTKAYCGTAEPSVVNEDYLLKNWRGGRYHLQATMNGHYVTGGTRQITIYEPPIDPASLRARNEDISAGRDGGRDGEINILREQINRQHEMVLKILEQNSKGNNAPTLPEIMGMVRDMQAMSKPPDIMAVLPNILDLFKTSVELARDSAGGGDKGMNWIGLIEKVADKLPAMIGQVGAMRANPSRPGAERDAETMQAQADVLLREALAYLKRKHANGKTSESVCDTILDNMDDASYHNLAVLILNRPFEQIAALDADFGQEPMKSWLLKIYTDLKLGVSNEDSEPVTGPGGGASDVAGNETGDD